MKQMPYRVFSMDSSGSLYYLCRSGWSKRLVLTFNTLESVRHWLFTHFVGELPDAIDVYIAKVYPGGQIMKTFSICEEHNESNNSNI